MGGPIFVTVSTTQKMEFRTYFVNFHTFSYKSKSNELPRSFGCLLPWVPEGFIFFLFFLAKIEGRSRDREEREKKSSSHGNYEPHFHAIWKQDMRNLVRSLSLEKV